MLSTFIGLLTLSGEQMLNANEGDEQQEPMEWQAPNLPSQEMPSTSSAHQQGPPIYEQVGLLFVFLTFDAFVDARKG